MSWAYDEPAYRRNAPICLGGCNRLHARSGACAEDGVSHIDHANANFCPLRKFPAGIAKPPEWPQMPAADLEALAIESLKSQIPLPGDLLAAVTAKIGVKAAVAWWSANVTGQPCHCADRQKWLNEMGEKFYRWAGLR